MDFGQNLKNYAVALDPATDRYMLGGTSFTSFPNDFGNELHLVWLDGLGNVIRNRFYDAPNRDERLVDLHYLNANEVVSVSLLRGDQPLRPDMFKVLRTDVATGAITADYVFQSAFNSFPNLYPMSSCVYNNKTLFVCGYATKAVTANPLQPTITAMVPNAKVAFVASIDIPSGAVNAMQFFDYAVPGQVFDADLARSCKVISVGGTDRLYVTGGANISDGLTSGCGTLNLVLDVSTLATAFATKPFYENLGTGGAPYFVAPYEFGYDIDEYPAGSGNWFVFGNSGQITDVGASPTSGDINVFTSSWTTLLTPTFANSSITGSRKSFGFVDYILGLSTMPSAVNPNQRVISGYMMYDQCNHVPAPGPANVNPFLAECYLQATGPINNTAYAFPRVYYSVLTTLSSPNSFWAMGGWLSNMAFAPRIADRRPVGNLITNNIFMGAPVAYAPALLGLKTIRTDQNGDVFTCNGSYGLCQYYAQSPSVFGCIGCAFTEHPFPVVPVEWPSAFTDADPPNINDCFFSGQYRISSPTSKSASNLIVTPQPAQEYMTLTLTRAGEQSPSSSMHIRMQDLTGKLVKSWSELLTGSVTTVELSVSDVTSGMYMLYVSTDGENMKPVKC
jgi:hypothetical protein